MSNWTSNILMKENNNLILDNCVLIGGVVNSVEGVPSSKVYNYNSVSQNQYSTNFNYGLNWLITDLTVDINVI